MSKRKADDAVVVEDDGSEVMYEDKKVKIEDMDIKVKKEFSPKKEPQAVNMARQAQQAKQAKQETVVGSAKKEEKHEEMTTCPYLDTIDRKVLDFDFEKNCSVSLSNLNVYACLVCGKYYQGRGKKTHAYTHSLEADHHVFINLCDEKIYCLPDGYEVRDPSLWDIQYNLHPTFTRSQVVRLSNNNNFTHALDGTDYLPGVIGLNNTKSTDWLNVVVQMLVRIGVFRNFFIFEKNYSNARGECNSLLVRRFGELVCKMWNPENFHGHISPHELLQAVMTRSNKKFRIGKQADPLHFLSWFLNTMHRDIQKLTPGKKKKHSPVTKSFQGKITVFHDTPAPANEDDEDGAEQKWNTTQSEKNFLYLSLDLPPAPLFKDSMDHNIIPQVPLFDLLNKFDGEKAEYGADGSRTRYLIKELPKYLVIHVKRFKQNNWFTEKNPTLVNFPIRNLDMKTYKASTEAPSEHQLEKLSIKELKQKCAVRKIDVSKVVEKDELVGKLIASYATQKIPTKYDLIANICHDGKPDKGTYRVHVYHDSSDTWYEMQDLHVWSTETMPQLVAISETYIQVYKLQSTA